MRRWMPTLTSARRLYCHMKARPIAKKVTLRFACSYHKRISLIFTVHREHSPTRLLPSPADIKIKVKFDHPRLIRPDTSPATNTSSTCHSSPYNLRINIGRPQTGRVLPNIPYFRHPRCPASRLRVRRSESGEVDGSGRGVCLRRGGEVREEAGEVVG